MTTILYRLIKEKKINATTTQMARIEVLNDKGEVINSMTTSKIFKHYDYGKLAERLFTEYLLSL